MTRQQRSLTHFAAWFAMLGALGCAPPPPAAKQNESKATSAEVKFSKHGVVLPSDETPVVATAPIAPASAAATAEPQRDVVRDDWGTISGKFKLVGNAPQMKEIYPTKDGHVCGAKETLREEHLIVGKSGELANVVAYAMASPDGWQNAISPIHASYEKHKGSEAILDNVNCRFEPHVLGIWTEQPIRYQNSDPGIGHNAFGQPFVNVQWNTTIPDSGSFVRHYPKAERLPFSVSCSIHPWMKSYVLVRPDPYFAISRKDGAFEIKNFPAGVFSFQFWHESLGYLKTITVAGKPRDDKKGIYAFTVKPGNNALGEITIAATDYAKQLDKLK